MPETTTVLPDPPAYDPYAPPVVNDRETDAAGIFASTDILDQFGGVYTGDVNKWWESSIPEETRKPFDEATRDDPVARANDRAYNANWSLMSKVYGEDFETIKRGYDGYLGDFAQRLGLDPETTDDVKVYNRVSQLIDGVKAQRDSLRMIDEAAVKAAIAGAAPNYKKLVGFSEDGHKGGHLRFLEVYRETAAKVKAVEKKYERVLGRLALDYTGAVTGEQFTPEELEDFIVNTDDDEFKLVVSMMASRVGKDSDKGTGKAVGEEIVRGFADILGGITTMDQEVHAALMETYLRNAKEPTLFVHNDLLKDGRFGELFAAEPGRGTPISKEKRDELLQEIEVFRRVTDRRQMLEDIAETGIDPNLTGNRINDYLVTVAQQVPYMATALLPTVGVPALGAYLGEVNFRELMQENPEMRREDALAVGMTSGIVEAASERIAALVTFGQLRIPSFTRTVSPGIQGVLGKYSARALTSLLVENAQEGVQDLMLPIATELYERLEKDAPEFDWGAKWDQWKDTRADVAVTLVPFSLLGAIADNSQARSVVPKEVEAVIRGMLADKKTLRDVLGFKPADIKAIEKAESTENKLKAYSKAMVNAGKPGPLANDTSPQKAQFRQALIDKGFVANEQEADAQVELADAVFRRVAQEQGITVEDAYNRVDLTREEGKGDLMVEAGSELAQQDVQRDQDYLKAVEAGDMATAQKLVDEAARAAGFTVKGFHGSPDFIGESFSKEYLGRNTGLSRGGFSFAPDRASAESYMAEGVDAEQYMVDAANAVVAKLANIDPNETWTGPYEETWSVLDFRSSNVDDINELSDYLLEIASSLDAKYPDLATELRAAANIGYRDPSPRLIEAWLKNPKILDIHGRKAYIVEDPSRIKSADPVTRDAQGNVIPLSQRFDATKDSIRYQGKKGYIRFMEDGKALIGLTEKGDASTFIHELGHFARRYALADKHLQTLGDYYGVDEATGKWDVEAEERFARDFERYVYDGQLPDNADSKLKRAFKVLKDLMRAIYETLKGSPIGANLDPEVRSAIDSIFEGKGIEEDVRPGESMEILGFIDGATAEAWAKLDAMFGTSAQRITQQFDDPKIRKARAILLENGEVPDFMRDSLKLSEKRKSAVTQAFKNMAREYQRKLKKVPKANQQQVDDTANAALGGNQTALNALPADIRETVIMARESIDILSKFLVDRGFLDEKIEATIGANIGTYLTRSYRIFDEKSGWAQEVWNHPNIIQAAEAELMAGGLTQQEAMDAIKKMTDKSRAMGFVFGGDKISGKIDITSFIKRQDLSKPIRDLLGERRNPVENMLLTGSKLGRIIASFDMQEEVKRVGLNIGIFSTKEDVSKRHIKQLFPNEKLNFTATVPGVGDVEIFRQFKNKRMAGLRGVWTTPEIAAAITDYLEKGVNSPESIIQFLTRGWMKGIGIGKVAQVIWNTPSSLPSNLASSAGFELFNGRATPWNYAKGLGIKWAKGAYSVVEQDKVNRMTGRDFQAQKTWESMPLKAVEQEMLARGALDENVFIGDMMAALNASGLELTSNTLKQVNEFLVSLYQAPDNASKYNAFVWEANKWMKAEPDKSVAWAFDMAGRDVRATTQTYSEVNKALRDLSRFGLLNTYMSFTHELVRNMLNTVRLGYKEMISGNKVLRHYGMWRLASASAFMAAITGVTRMLIQSIFDDRDEYEKLRKWAVAPWMAHKVVVPMSYDSTTKVFRYFDPSYVVPHVQMLDPILAAVYTEGDTGDKTMAAMSAFLGNFVELGILMRAVGEVLLNKETGGGSVYKEGLRDTKGGDRKILQEQFEHIFESAFRPGIMATIDRINKAKKDAHGAYGRIYSEDEEFWRLIAVRPITTNVQDLATSKLGEFHYRYLDAAQIQPGKQKTIPEEEYAELGTLELEAKETVYRELVEFMRDLGSLGIDMQQARKDLKEITGVSIVRKDFFDKALREANQ